MFFTPIIDRFDGPAALAALLELPTKNVRRWVDFDSIPAEWFAAVERAAKARGFKEITVRHLAALAEERRLARAEPASEAA